MISIKNVNKWYGDFQVLTDCSTEVKKGEVVVVCGPSGSGKSTLIKCVNALEPFQKGDIVVDGVLLGADSDDVTVSLYDPGDGMTVRSFDVVTTAADQHSLIVIGAAAAAPAGTYRVILRVNNQQARVSPSVTVP